jgi:hypothetical protein
MIKNEDYKSWDGQCEYDDTESFLAYGKLEIQGLEDHSIFGSLVTHVYGKMDECDGEFAMTLVNGDEIEYMCTYNPNPYAKNNDYFRFKDASGKKIDLGFETYSEQYISMGPLFGALTMYVMHKLGIK